MDAVGLTAGDLEIAWPRCTSGEDDGVVLRTKLLDVAVNANVRVRYERLKIGISTRYG